MPLEYDINQIVWSTLYEELVTIAEIHINEQGITYIDLTGIEHVSADLSAEKPMMTHEQFDKVWAKWDCGINGYAKGSVFSFVKDCIKEVQE